jgi:hypothetical protein
MTPTNKLRFVERDCYIKNGESFVEPFKQRILQQWDHVSNFVGGKFQPQGEWRDVPVEKEA